MARSGRRQNALVCTALVLAIACQPATTSAPPGGASPAAPTATVVQKLGEVSIRVAGDWDTLDPHKTVGSTANQIITGMYDRLVGLGPNGTLVPYIARSWSLAPGKVTFEVRTDATCADGTPVTPTVIANSLQRGFEISPAAGPMFGARPYSATATDSTHVTVTFGSLTTDVLFNFTDPRLSIVCPAGLLPGADYATSSYGSGPYTLVSATHGEGVSVKLRPDWRWGPEGTTGEALPSAINIKVVANDTTAANLVLTGGLDITFVTGPDVQRLRQDSSLTHIEAFPPTAQRLYFNNGSPDRPTADHALREAISTAIDRAAWNQAANDGQGRVATSYIDEDVACYEPNTANLIAAFNIDKAKEILRQAGYVTGSDGTLTKESKPVTLKLIGAASLNSGPDYLLAQITALGIKGTLLKTDLGTYTTNLRAGDWDLAVQGVSNPIPNPSIGVISLRGKAPPDGGNFSRTNNPAADAAIEEAQTATSEQERCAAWSRVQELYLRNHDILPLATAPTHWFTRGITTQPASINSLLLYTLRKS